MDIQPDTWVADWNSFFKKQSAMIERQVGGLSHQLAVVFGLYGKSGFLYYQGQKFQEDHLIQSLGHWELEKLKEVEKFFQVHGYSVWYKDGTLYINIPYKLLSSLLEELKVYKVSDQNSVNPVV